MRVCIMKSTGKLLEMQSDATEGTLLQNAINAGFAEVDIEEKEVTEAEWQVILDAQPKPDIPKSQLQILQETVDQLVLDSLGV